MARNAKYTLTSCIVMIFCLSVSDAAPPIIDIERGRAAAAEAVAMTEPTAAPAKVIIPNAVDARLSSIESRLTEMADAIKRLGAASSPLVPLPPIQPINPAVAPTQKYHDISSARAASLASHRPALLSFKGQGCQPCMRFAAFTLADKGVSKLIADKVVLAEVFIETLTPAEKKDWNIQVVPQCIVVNAEWDDARRMPLSISVGNEKPRDLTPQEFADLLRSTLSLVQKK